MTEYIGMFSGGKDSLIACYKAWKDGLICSIPSGLLVLGVIVIMLRVTS